MSSALLPALCGLLLAACLPSIRDPGDDTGSGGTCDEASWPDADGDGWGDDGGPTAGCPAPEGYAVRAGDCDDGDAQVHPGIAERCNGLDDDCDEGVDEGLESSTWYRDADGDGWGVEADPLEACAAPGGYADRTGDCDDLSAVTYPAARELCEGYDNDCDGEADEGCDGTCGDGVKGGRYEACDGDDDEACPGACSRHCACPSAEPGGLRVHLVDVGQGDALLVISPSGFVLLVDAGPSSACDDLAWYLESHGIAAIDYTLVSHQHSDHNANMDDEILAHPEVVACFDNGGDFDTSYDWDYEDAAGARRVPLALGDTIDLGPQVRAEVLHSDVGAGNENLNSVVLLLEYGEFRMLLGGDCEEPCEATVETDPVDVYKVHHHGSDDSSSLAFLERIAPLVGFIPVGADNDYGHPAASTLRKLEALGVAVYRTDEDGDVLLTSDGEGFSVAGVDYP
jgi:beta-lactamase superfamily II metal-dependent hydrolase